MWGTGAPSRAGGSSRFLGLPMHLGAWHKQAGWHDQHGDEKHRDEGRVQRVLEGKTDLFRVTGDGTRAIQKAPQLLWRYRMAAGGMGQAVREYCTKQCCAERAAQVARKDIRGGSTAALMRAYTFLCQDQCADIEQAHAETHDKGTGPGQYG